MRNKLRSTIGGDVGGNPVFGEHVHDEQECQTWGVYVVVGRNKDPLLGESIYDYKDRSVAMGGWELLDKVHGDGVPWLLRDWELLKESVRMMSSGLGASAGGTGFAVLYYEGPEFRPGVIASD
jgi:hypothetical protein